MNKDVATVVGFIMYYDLLQRKINGSFFMKIEKAIELAESFCAIYPEDFIWGVEIEFEDTLTNFLEEKISLINLDN